VFLVVGGREAVIDEINVAEVSLAVVLAKLKVLVGRVLGARGAGLHEGGTMGADDEAVGILVVQAVFLTMSCAVGNTILRSLL
jgi:hypothetical protein